jgi:hypothetical protein
MGSVKPITAVNGQGPVEMEPRGPARKNANMDLDMQQQFYTPSYAQESMQRTEVPTGITTPSWMPRTLTHMPVKYQVPTEEKELLERRAALAAQPDVQRVMQVGPELDYMKYMQDMAELAKFDNYVEALVDPKQPGSADFLFKVYPEYVNRRMSQAHQDYQFAMRNQMIDMWGINTFDDLYFKYMVDQGKLKGPKLSRAATDFLDDKYVSVMSTPSMFGKQMGSDVGNLNLPFSSTTIGSRSGPDAINRNVKDKEMPYSSYPGQNFEYRGKALSTVRTNQNDPEDLIGG